MGTQPLKRTENISKGNLLTFFEKIWVYTMWGEPLHLKNVIAFPRDARLLIYFTYWSSRI